MPSFRSVMEKSPEDEQLDDRVNVSLLRQQIISVSSWAQEIPTSHSLARAVHAPLNDGAIER